MSIEPARLSYMERIHLISRDARLTIGTWMAWAFGYGINDVLFNLYLLEAGFEESFIGFFLSISISLTGLLAIGIGMLADRFSRKKMLLVGYTIVLLSVFIQYSTLNPLYLIFSQLLNGVGFGITGVCWQPYTVSVTTDEERVHVFTIRFAFFLLASLFGSVIGGFLPTVWNNLGIAVDLSMAYRLSLWIALIPMSIGALIIVPMTTDTVEGPRRRFGFGHIRHRDFIGKYALAWSVSGLGAGLFVQFFNVFFTLAFAADSATIGIIFGINTLVMAGGNFASPAIVDRFGKLGTIIWFQVLSIPFLMILSWSPILSIAVFGFVGRALFMNIAWPVMDVFYMEGLDKMERSTAMGIINAGDSLSRAVGLNIGGWLLGAGFLRMPFALATILYSVSIVIFYYFFGTTSGPPPEEDEARLRQSSMWS
ncbi:MAG: MFS transporter [Candidatus Thorarchaeota archaeon]